MTLDYAECPGIWDRFYPNDIPLFRFSKLSPFLRFSEESRIWRLLNKRWFYACKEHEGIVIVVIFRVV